MVNYKKVKNQLERKKLGHWNDTYLNKRITKLDYKKIQINDKLEIHGKTKVLLPNVLL